MKKNSKSRRGRPTVLAQLRTHFEKSNIFPDLESIASTTVEEDALPRIADVVNAIVEKTTITFGIEPFRAMIKRAIRASHKVTLLHQPILYAVANAKRGAPVGSCLGQIRNPAGRPVGSKNQPGHKAGRKRGSKNRSKE